MTGYLLGVAVFSGLVGTAMLPAVIDDKRRKVQQFFDNQPGTDLSQDSNNERVSAR